MATYLQEQRRVNFRFAPHYIFVCPECGRGFCAQSQWRQHLNIKHGYRHKTYVDFHYGVANVYRQGNYFVCKQCDRFFAKIPTTTLVQLQYHYFVHCARNRVYRCLHCSVELLRRRDMNVHIELEHMNEVLEYEAQEEEHKRLREEQEQAALHADIAPQDQLDRRFATLQKQYIGEKRARKRQLQQRQKGKQMRQVYDALAQERQWEQDEVARRQQYVFTESMLTPPSECIDFEELSESVEVQVPSYGDIHHNDADSEMSDETSSDDVEVIEPDEEVDANDFGNEGDVGSNMVSSNSLHSLSNDSTIYEAPLTDAQLENLLNLFFQEVDEETASLSDVSKTQANQNASAEKEKSINKSESVGYGKSIKSDNNRKADATISNYLTKKVEILPTLDLKMTNRATDTGNKKNIQAVKGNKSPQKMRVAKQVMQQFTKVAGSNIRTVPKSLQIIPYAKNYKPVLIEQYIRLDSNNSAAYIQRELGKSNIFWNKNDELTNEEPRNKLRKLN